MVDIVAPGGSYKKAMIAAKFGADAVYVGVPFLSLRMRQNKIKDFEILKKTVDDLHAMGKKAYLTINIFPRNTDIRVIEMTIAKIQGIGADAVIFSDPGVFMILKKYLKDNIKYHLSTQTNTLDSLAVKFWADQGVDRVVLARELLIKEILEIKKSVPHVELEAFVHGAMCMTYSGRCLLGEYFSGRDGNKGECSHVCRYNFNVYLEEEKRPGKFFKVDEDESGSFLLSSKDLCTIEHGKELYEAIDAWKIEGRSKSEFYVGSVVKAYSHLRDSVEKGEEPNKEILDLVYSIPHRDYWDGFLFNNIRSAPDGEEGKTMVQTTTKTSAGPLDAKQYIGTTTGEIFKKDGKTYYEIDPKYNIFLGDKFEVLDKTGIIKETTVTGILGENKQDVEKLTCNMNKAFISGYNLSTWNIIVK